MSNPDQQPRESAAKPGAGPAGCSPYSKTGSTLGQPNENKKKIDPQTGNITPSAAANYPALSKRRRSRARETSEDMAGFLMKHASFDWFQATVPNQLDGSGRRSPGEAGRREDERGVELLTKWAAANGLHELKIAPAPMGYRAGLSLGPDPTRDFTKAFIWTGHEQNMPVVLIPGAGGALIPGALAELGPLNTSRLDVAIDVVREGLWDELLEYAEAAASRSKKQARPRIKGEEDSGRTFYFGGGDPENRKPRADGKVRVEKPVVEVCIYEKGLEQIGLGRKADRRWVRIEFRFRPKKHPEKAAYRRAALNGPAAVLGSVLWVRQMVKHIHQTVEPGAASELGVTRLDKTPVAKTARERAEHGFNQYMSTFTKAAIAEILERFEDASEAVASPSEVADGVINFITDQVGHRRGDGSWSEYSLHSAIHKNCDRIGLEQVRSEEEEAARMKVRLSEYLDHQQQETAAAHAGLAEKMARAAAGARRRDRNEPAPPPDFGENVINLNRFFDRMKERSAA